MLSSRAPADATISRVPGAVGGVRPAESDRSRRAGPGGCRAERAGLISYLDVDDTIRANTSSARQGAGYGYSKVNGLNALIGTLASSGRAPIIVATRLRKGAVPSARSGWSPTLWSPRAAPGGRRGSGRNSGTSRCSPDRSPIPAVPAQRADVHRVGSCDRWQRNRRSTCWTCGGLRSAQLLQFERFAGREHVDPFGVVDQRGQRCWVAVEWWEVRGVDRPPVVQE